MLGFAVRVAAGVGVVDTWTGPDAASKISTLFANSRNSYVPSVAGIAKVHEPDDRAVLPAFRAQLLVYTYSSYAPLGVPETYRAIQSRVVGLATSLQLTVTVPPGATVLGFAVRVAAAAVDARAKRNAIASAILNLVTFAPSTIDHLKQGLRVFGCFHKCTTPVPRWRRRPNQNRPGRRPSTVIRPQEVELTGISLRELEEPSKTRFSRAAQRPKGRVGEAYVAALGVSLFLCKLSLDRQRILSSKKIAT